MRNNRFLQQRLEDIWERYFSDVPKNNDIYIEFGRKAKKRLGSIRRVNLSHNSHKFDTLILINGYFKSFKVPVSIVDATIAHELCHYTHGFSSPLPKLSPYPHRGGIVDKEMQKRGLENLVEHEQEWLNANWQKMSLK